MKIIGHRGAAGMALENTVESIQSAIAAGVDAVEVDVRLTKDGHLVLSHDRDTSRVSAAREAVRDSLLEELQQLQLHGNNRIATLPEAIKVVGSTPLVIEGKDSAWAQPLARLLHEFKHKKFVVISFNHNELEIFSSLCPNIPVYGLEHTAPFDAIHQAREHGFTGIDINFWLLNPLTYYWARHEGLEIIVYTVNKVWMARFLKFLYPHISITTNNPHKLGFLSDIKKRERAQRKHRKVHYESNARSHTRGS